MSRRSEEWDIEENDRTKQSNLFREFIENPEFRYLLNQAMALYDHHKKPGCRIIKILIVDENALATEEEIKRENLERKFVLKILKCKTCGWDFKKKWWQFWK